MKGLGAMDIRGMEGVDLRCGLKRVRVRAQVEI